MIIVRILAHRFVKMLSDEIASATDIASTKTTNTISINVPINRHSKNIRY